MAPAFRLARPSCSAAAPAAFARQRTLDVESGEYSFRGPAYFDGTKYQRLDIEDEEDRAPSKAITNGWIAALQLPMGDLFPLPA